MAARGDNPLAADGENAMTVDKGVVLIGREVQLRVVDTDRVPLVQQNAKRRLKVAEPVIV
jgi:hypothetical protein